MKVGNVARSLGVISALLIVGISHAWASGADDLLRATGSERTQATVSGGAVSQSSGTYAVADASQFKLDDPYTLRFFDLWNSAQLAGHLPYDVNGWAQRILKGQYESAAHLWTAIQNQIPQGFESAALSGQLYCLWKLGLSQTFFDQWLAAIRSKPFLTSPANMALEQTISPDFDRWLLDRAIVLNPDQKQFIQTLDAGHDFVQTTLKAYANLRGGLAALPLLPLLPAGNALKIPLAETATLALAQQGDLARAAHVLKDDLEPALALQKDPHLLAEHYIQVARLLYQAGSLEGAQQYYEKVPTGIPAYLSAREELMWVWLRMGDTSRLRGELVSLSSPIFSDRFDPELYLVQAISNLKLCFYDGVAKNFQEFIAANTQWAREISDAEKAQNPPPARDDFYTKLVERSYDHLKGEAQTLVGLEQRSIGAALPSVGPQLHWKTAYQSILAMLESVKKDRAEEYRRQWRNRQQILQAAILKMKFVKVEYLSELQVLAENGDRISVSSAAPMSAPRTKANDQQAERNIAKDGQMTFPFDGTYWADEVFRLRSLTHGQCLGR